MNPHRVAIVVIALCVLVYWSRVLAMALAARRRTGHAAGLVPRERLGRWIRLLWTPVVLLWIFSPWMALGSGPTAFLPIGEVPLYGDIIASALAVLALLGTFLCWRKMGRQWQMGISPGVRNKLITSGPFAQVRHPIYALSMLLMACTAVAIPSPVILVIAPLHIAMLYWEARREELHLRQVHGAGYDDYFRRTGRFLPRLRRTERNGTCTSSA